MTPSHLQLVPDRYDDLPPKTREDIFAIDDAYAKAVTGAAPDLGASTEAVKAAYAAVNAAHKLFRDAAADLVVFSRAAGAQVERLSRWSRVAIGFVLFAITCGEITLGFPGLRYALGHRGDIQSPLEDPLALVAAVAFGLLSFKLANAAAREWMGAGRGVLHEPAPAEVTAAPGVPELLLDADGRRLIPESALGGELATVTPLPASDEALQARFEHVLRDSVPRRSRVRRAGLLAAIGIALWGANGYMRSEYVTAVGSRTTVSQATGLGVVVGATAPANASDPVLELVLVGLGIVFFVGMILVSARGESALTQRERALQLHHDQRLRELRRAVARATDAIRTFERQRGVVEYAGASADTQRGVASAAGTRG